MALATRLPDHHIDLWRGTGQREFQPGKPLRADPPPDFTPVPPGSYKSAAALLLTDGP